MADVVLKPGTTPGDLAVPDTAQKIVNLLCSYVTLDGLAGLQGIIISDTEPVTTDRDKAWLKLDVGTGRAIGIYRYLGGWQQVPVIVGTGESEPAGAKVGELFFNSDTKVLKVYSADGWTSELWQHGNTDDRPEDAPIGYVYFDETIKRLLRFTSEGWSTVDGCIGEVRMFDGMSADEAEDRNPGWVIFADMSGRFPVGYQDGEVAVGATGGRESFPVSASGGKNNAQSGSEISLNGLTIDELKIGGSGAVVSYAGSTASGNKDVSIIPPYKALIFMRKQF